MLEIRNKTAEGDENDSPLLVLEGPNPDGEFKLTIPYTCFGSSTARYLTREQMVELADYLDYNGIHP